MKTLRINCDRCGEAIPVEVTAVILDISGFGLSPQGKDICTKCWQDFKEWMDAKGVVHLWRKSTLDYGNKTSE